MIKYRSIKVPVMYEIINATVPIITISIPLFSGVSPVILLFNVPAINNIPNEKIDEIVSEINPKFKK